MTTEFEELRLQVALEDNASRGLADLRLQIAQLAGGSVAVIRNMNREIEEQNKRWAELGRTILGVGRTFDALRAVSSPVVLALGTAAYETIRVNQALLDFSEKVVQTSQKARLAATSYGEYKNFVEQLALMGINAEQADRMLNGLSETAADLAKGPMSEIAAKLSEHVFTPQQAANMQRWIGLYVSAGSDIERANLTRAAALDAYNTAYAETIRLGESQKAAEAAGVQRAEELLGLLHQTKDVLLLNQNLRAPSPDDVRRWNAMDQHAKDYYKYATGIAQRWEDIKALFHDKAFGPDSPQYSLMKNIDEFLTKWDDDIKKAQDRLKEFRAPEGFWAKLNPFDPRNRARERAEFGWEQNTQPKLLDPLLQRMGVMPKLQSGGIVTKPTIANIGEHGPEAVVPLTGPTMYRAEEQARKRNEQTEANTDEVRELNRHLDDLLDTIERDRGWGPGTGTGGGGGYGGGGGGGGGGYGTGTPGGVGQGPGPGGTYPAPPPPMAPSGAPLGAVQGGQPFGVNVTPDQFRNITYLPPSFMNVSPEQREMVRQIATGVGPAGRTGLGGENLGKKAEYPWPVTQLGGGTGPGIGRGDPLPSGASVDQNQLYQRLVDRFRNSPLNGFVPKDGARWGITKGTPEEWAQHMLAVGKQESGLRNNVKDGLFQFNGQDLRNYGVPGAVGDPNAQLEAAVRVYEKFVPKDGVISAPGDVGVGAARYFGSVRLRHNGGRSSETDKYMPWAGQVASANQVVSPTSTGLLGAPAPAVSVSPIIGLPTALGGSVPVTAGGAGAPSGIADVSNQVGRLSTGGFMKSNPEALVVHHTGGSEKTPQELAGTLRSRTDAAPGGLSVQYFIDPNGKISMLTPQDKEGRPSVAWQLGPAEKSEQAAGRQLSNMNTVGVEVSASDEKHVTDAQRAAIAQLYSDLSDQYGWDKTGGVEKHVYGHGELTGRKEAMEGHTAALLRTGKVAVPESDQSREARATAQTQVAEAKPVEAKPAEPPPTEKPAAHDEPKPEEGGEPKKQFGGIFNRATRAIIGEAGPEMVLPIGKPLRDIDSSILDHFGLRNAAGAARFVINHKNAPAGVNVSLAGDLFKNATMNRQTAFR